MTGIADDSFELPQYTILLAAGRQSRTVDLGCPSSLVVLLAFNLFGCIAQRVELDVSAVRLLAEEEPVLLLHGGSLAG